jgi:thousand and one amino acid protein kinase
MKQNVAAEKKIMKEITNRQEADRKAFDTQKKKEYKTNKERWKRELSLDESTPKRQRDLALQLIYILYYYYVIMFKQLF